MCIRDRSHSVTLGTLGSSATVTSFFKLKEYRGGKHSESDKYLQKTVITYINELVMEVYDMGIQKLFQCSDKCLNIQGKCIKNLAYG